MIDIAKAKKFIDQCSGDEIAPTLVEYIRIPNKSPAFDLDLAAHGFMRGPLPTIIPLPSRNAYGPNEFLHVPTAAGCRW